MHFLSKLSLMMLFTTSTGTFCPSCFSIKFTSVYDCEGKGRRGSMRLFPGLLCQLFSVVDKSTTDDKIVETLYSNGVTSGNKRIHTALLSPLPRPLPPPLALRSKLGCLLFSIGSLNIGATLHGGDGGGKAYFLFLKSIKRKKAQFRTKCLNSFCCR